MKKIRELTALITALIIVAPLSAQAATTTERVNFKSEMTHLFVWSDDAANMQFDAIDLTDKKLAGWSLVTLGDAGGAPLIADGPELKKGSAKFDITFNYASAPFSFQFAAVLFDAATTTHVINDSGNFTYNGSKLGKSDGSGLSFGQLADVNAHFSPSGAVVPIPDSMVLALSAIGFLGVYSRRPAPATAGG